MAGTAAVLLKDARAHAGLSRRSLAMKAGVPTSTVSRIEEEASDPTVSMLERLLAASGARLTVNVVPFDSNPTIAELARALDQNTGRLKIDWTRLRGFADWAAQHHDQVAKAIADPPIRTGTPLDAILAAFAEQLAIEHGTPRPRWTRSVGPLKETWSPPGTPRMLAAAANATPEPFMRRNLVLTKSSLFRHAG